MLLQRLDMRERVLLQFACIYWIFLQSGSLPPVAESQISLRSNCKEFIYDFASSHVETRTSLISFGDSDPNLLPKPVSGRGVRQLASDVQCVFHSYWARMDDNIYPEWILTGNCSNKCFRGTVDCKPVSVNRMLMRITVPSENFCGAGPKDDKTFTLFEKAVTTGCNCDLPL